LRAYCVFAIPMSTCRLLVLIVMVATASGCDFMRPSRGGGQTDFAGDRRVQPTDVALSPGYRIEAVATGLSFPTGVAFDDTGKPYIAESGYSYGEVFTTPRLLRVERDGETAVVATGSNNGPWTGLAFFNGAFYVAEGGVNAGGRILRVTPGGESTKLVDKLPSLGDHHTDGPVVGPDGWVYFGQGTATNSAVVGLDNAQFGWLKRHPEFHDTPCHDITLTGRNYRTKHWKQNGEMVSTGAFSPFGVPTTAGQTVRGATPCNGAVFRIGGTGGALELVAWGLRNPFGLAFAPDGQLYVTENGYDDRGSRPAWGTPDVMWRIVPGSWYGWPDFSFGRPLDNKEFKPPRKERLERLLKDLPGQPPEPVAIFGVHASANAFDFSRNPVFGYAGQAFVALFGDQAPATGKVDEPVGFKVVRVDVATGAIEDFAVNKAAHNGPASKLGGGGLERPIAARFNPQGTALYVVDFGVLTQNPQANPRLRTGVLWRITREGVQ